jgi:hypothetical protein
MIFVFGSNLAGRHGKGAAYAALKYHGAIYGQGEGLQGNSYAIPTKDKNIKTLPLDDIDDYVWKFRRFAENHKDMRFYVTALGTGLAGYKVSDIAPMFRSSPENVYLCDEFKEWLDGNES